MSGNENSTPREIERLIQELDDGTLSPEDRDLLLGLMRDSPELRKAYIEHQFMVAALHHHETISVAALRDEERPSDISRWRAFLKPVGLAVAALLIIGLIITNMIRPPEKRATVNAGAGAVWSFVSGGIDEKGTFSSGTRLAVEQGIVEIVMRSGTRMILEGPTDFEIIGNLETRLASGTVWCELATGDEGLSVTTQRLRTVDLGTRFGVRVGAQRDEVHVAQGLVEVNAAAKNAAPVKLSARQALAGGSDGALVSIPSEPNGFQRDIASITWLAHWSFDGDDWRTDVAGEKNEKRLAFLGSGEGEAKLVPGMVGRALDLSDHSSPVACAFPGVTGSALRSVAFRFRAPNTRKSAESAAGPAMIPILGWGNPAIPGARWNITISANGTRIGTDWGGGSASSAAPGGYSVNDGRWHHVAVVFTGLYDSNGVPEIRHYLDGTPLRATSTLITHPINTLEGASGLVLGAGAGPSPADSPRLPIQFDEVMIGRHALTAESVRKLANRHMLAAREVK